MYLTVDKAKTSAMLLFVMSSTEVYNESFLLHSSLLYLQLFNDWYGSEIFVNNY